VTEGVPTPGPSDPPLPALGSAGSQLPVDPDIEDPGAEWQSAQPQLLAAISAGGILGAVARYGVGSAWPPSAGFPWTTFAVNISGCLLIGLVVVVATERQKGHPLLRPFLGTGLLGGFTTFSTYTVEAHRLLLDGRYATALGYVGATLACAVLAAALGLQLGRRLTGDRVR
jgi:CrcB protein